MNRHISLFSVGCIAIAGVLSPLDRAAAQAVAEPPTAVVDTDPPAEALVPSGEPARISDWALAGVVWGDAHLVRKLAVAARDQAETPDRRDTMELLVQDCDSLIQSLETFGWRRIAMARADRTIETAPVAVSEAVAEPEVVVDPDTAVVPSVEVAAAAPETGLVERVEVERPAVDVDLDADGDVEDSVVLRRRPFDLRRYSVDTYVDRTVNGLRTTSEAVEDGVEEAVAGGPVNATAGFDVERGSGIGRLGQREAQTQSATLPYANNSIYEVDNYHPNAAYPDYVPADTVDDVPVVPTTPGAAAVVEAPGAAAVVEADAAEILDAAEGAADPVIVASDDAVVEEGAVIAPARRAALVDIARYTDRADRFNQDADWVKFQLSANQRRWLILRDQVDQLSTAALTEQVNAALLQLQSDAAAALAATRDPQLAEVLQIITD